MLLGKLGASLLANMLAGKAKIPGREVMGAVERTSKASQNF